MNMDYYGRFIKTNVGIRFVGYMLSIIMTLCVIFSVIKENSLVCIYPMLVANIIASFRNSWLTKREDYNEEEYDEADEEDNKKHTAILLTSAIALLLIYVVKVIVK